MSKRWEKFAEVSKKCYIDMEKGKIHLSVWNQAYQILKELIQEERTENPAYAKELYQIDDSQDFEYGVEEWILDYEDLLDTMQEYRRLQKVCEELIAMFEWKEYSPTDFRFHTMIAMMGQAKYQEAHAYGEQWYSEEDDNPYAAAALIYAKVGIKDYKEAERLVERLIPEGTVCCEENDMLFGAAEKLYEKMGNTEAEARILEALERYDEELEAYFEQMEEE